jgi:hypothetical protein
MRLATRTVSRNQRTKLAAAMRKGFPNEEAEVAANRAHLKRKAVRIAVQQLV